MTPIFNTVKINILFDQIHLRIALLWRNCARSEPSQFEEAFSDSGYSRETTHKYSECTSVE